MINFSEAAWFVALLGDSASRIGGCFSGAAIAAAFIDMRMCEILLAVDLFIMLVWVFTKLYYTRKMK